MTPSTSGGRPRARLIYLAVGLVFLGLGLVGVLLPGVPTTPFLLLASWAFSRSSRRLHDWLHQHPRWGPSIRDWNEHGVIPRRVKATALGGMGVSLLVMFAAGGTPMWAAIATTSVMAVGATFVLSRPSERRDD